MDDRKVKELSIEGVLHRVQPTKHFVYSVRVTWSDGMVNVVYRRYKQFLDLEKQIRDAFLNKEDSIPTLRPKSPNAPGKALKYVDEIAAFVDTLINLPTNISSCELVLEFFTLTEQDLSSTTKKSEANTKKVTLQKKNELNKKNRKKKGHRRGRFTRRLKTMKDGLISGPVQFEQYTVLETYKKQNKNDINLTEGQVVEVIEKRDNGWWFVEADEQLGWAPASFLQTTDFDVEDDFKITTFPRGKGEIYMTTKSYKAAMEDELSFDIGVNLQIVERNYAGWWRAIYLGKEGYVPAAYLKKIGSARHSVLQRHTREKRIPVVSRLEETIQEASDGDNASLHSSQGTLQRRNFDPYALISEMQSPHWTHSLPPVIASRSAPGSPQRTAKHTLLTMPGRPVRSLSNLVSLHSSNQLISPLAFSKDFMGSAGKKDEVNVDGSEMRAASISGSEENSILSEATSLSSLNIHNFTAYQLTPESSEKASTLTEPGYQTHQESRLENEDKTDNLTEGVENDERETDREVEGEEVEEEEEEEGGDNCEGKHLQDFSHLRYPPPPPPPQTQLREATIRKTRTEVQVDDLQYTECYEQTLNSIQESDDSSSDEGIVFTIDISGLSDDVQQMQDQQNFRAIASYEGDESSNELTLTEGEIVQVIQRKASGWWLALAHREMGWVPSNYLEESNNTRL